MENFFHNMSITECLKQLESSQTGLKKEECDIRLAKNGKNSLPESKKLNIFLRFLLQFKDVMIIILLASAVVSFVMHEYVDGGVILAIVILNAVLGFAQEFKAEKAMESLKNMTKPFAKVIRDGQVLKIRSEEVVVGDVVVLEAGDIVCADVRLIESAMLKCDESSLTGESVPVLKNAKETFSKGAVIGDRSNLAYSGSVVTYGRGKGVVYATGSETEIGKIAEILKTSKQETTPLQKSLKLVGKIVTAMVLTIAVVTFVIELTTSHVVDLKDALFTSIALAVAAIPESLPAVVTIIMALGVAKLAKKKAIVKKLHAVETLGCCEIICSDKTGTLTQNVMTVKKVFYNGENYNDIDCVQSNGDFKKLLKIMTLCNDGSKQDNKFIGDPTETALLSFAYGNGIDKQDYDKKFPRNFEIPFDSERKRMSTVCGEEMQLKGGVDEVLSVCSNYLCNGKVTVLTEEVREQILRANQTMSDEALRVLAGAYKEVVGGENYSESNMTFVGLAGMIDPPRADVKDAVAKCKNAGMRPIMITGDHKDTAFAIAKQIGIATEAKQVLTGAQIDKLSDEELMEKLKTISVFARVSPQNKVQIVNGFKKMGKIVAMTGDGVNDAPSLKSANIGVGMGITGTDVTKEVANVIVTDDSFSTIVVAVEEGRKIFKNIQKTINFLFASNLCEVLAILFGVIFFPDYVVLTAIQILFINLISDSLPALALGVEPAEGDLMKNPPRSAKDSVFSNGVWKNLLVHSVLQFILVISSFLIGFFAFKSHAVATTMIFLTLNFIQLFFVLTVRCEDFIYKCNIFKNKVLCYSIMALLAITVVVALTPVKFIFGLCDLSIWQWLIVVGLSVLIIPLNEAYKLIKKLFAKHKRNKKAGVVNTENSPN